MLNEKKEPLAGSFGFVIYDPADVDDEDAQKNEEVGVEHSHDVVVSFKEVAHVKAEEA